MRQSFHFSFPVSVGTIGFGDGGWTPHTTVAKGQTQVPWHWHFFVGLHFQRHTNRWRNPFTMGKGVFSSTLSFPRGFFFLVYFSRCAYYFTICVCFLFASHKLFTAFSPEKIFGKPKQLLIFRICIFHLLLPEMVFKKMTF